MASKREPRYCVWCPRQVKGSLEVLRHGKWRPVCRTCYRARGNQVARTLTEVDTGELRVPAEDGGHVPPQREGNKGRTAGLAALPR